MWRKFFGLLPDILNVILFIMMLILAIMQVFLRYLIRLPLPWTEEFARFSLIYLTFLGAAIALRERKHINIPTLLERLPQRFRLYLRLGFNLAIFLFLAAVLRGSLQMIPLMMGTYTGAVFWFKIAYLYMGVAIGIALMGIYLLSWTVEIVRELFSKF